MTDGETFLFFIFLSCSDEIFSQRDIIFIIYYFIQNVKCDGEKDLVFAKKASLPDSGHGDGADKRGCLRKKPPKA